MGTGQKLLTRVRSIFFCLGQVSSDWVKPFLVWFWIWNISPIYPEFFNFFPFGSKKSLRIGSKSTWVKDGSASYLLWIKSMIMKRCCVLCRKTLSLLLIDKLSKRAIHPNAKWEPTRQTKVLWEEENFFWFSDSFHPK